MAAAAPAPAAGAPAAARPPAPVHKSTAIIPGWSRPLSSQALTIECQKITQPNRSAAPKECYGVMELEVMKFVAYCGGLTIKLRIDDLQHGAVDRCAAGGMGASSSGAAQHAAAAQHLHAAAAARAHGGRPPSNSPMHAAAGAPAAAWRTMLTLAPASHPPAA